MPNNLLDSVEEIEKEEDGEAILSEDTLVGDEDLEDGEELVIIPEALEDGFGEDMRPEDSY